MVTLFGFREPQKQLSLETRKKVTFDPDVKTFEPDEDAAVGYEEGGVEKKVGQEEGNLVKPKQSQYSSLEASSSPSSSGSYPPNHRYQNCRESDDELGESDEELDDLDDSDLDLDDDDYDYVYEGGSFAESRVDLDKRDLNEVNSSMVKPTESNNPNARDRSAYVYPVLNPVENLTQWRALKERGKPQMKPHKKNSTLDNHILSSNSGTTYEEPSFSFKSKSHNQSSPQEMAVDASLSNWLSSSSETTPVNKTASVSTNSIMSQGSYSPISKEDRPILGALTLEEIKQFSPQKKSPTRSRSPDEMPIIGTVGTHWSDDLSKDSGSAATYNGIPNTTSKYREVYIL